MAEPKVSEVLCDGSRDPWHGFVFLLLFLLLGGPGVTLTLCSGITLGDARGPYRILGIGPRQAPFAVLLRWHIRMSGALRRGHGS